MEELLQKILNELIEIKEIMKRQEDRVANHNMKMDTEKNKADEILNNLLNMIGGKPNG